jgi:hypothetical protein
VLKGESYGCRTAHHHDYTQQFNKLVQHKNNEVDVLDEGKKTKITAKYLN